MAVFVKDLLLDKRKIEIIPCKITSMSGKNSQQQRGCLKKVSTILLFLDSSLPVFKQGLGKLALFQSSLGKFTLAQILKETLLKTIVNCDLDQYKNAKAKP